MKVHTNRIAAVCLCALVALTLACAVKSDVAVHTAAKVTLDYSQAVKTVQDTVINANKTGAVSDADTQTILNLCFRLNAAGQEVSRLVRGQAQLPAQDRTVISGVLSPLLKDVEFEIEQGVVKIGDTNTQNAVRTALITIQTVIQAAQSALIVGGN